MKKKKEFDEKKIFFVPVKRAHKALIYTWLKQPHVTPFFYGQGLQNTYDDLDRFMTKKKSVHSHWIAYYQNIPFAYLMNSEVTLKDEPYGKWIEKEVGMTLDLLIGDTDFLGQGICAPLIQYFLKEKTQAYSDIFIDPSLSNSKAIHVYQKVGFEKKETFKAPWDPDDECLLLKLNWEKILSSS